MVVASEVEHVRSDATMAQLLEKWMAHIEGDDRSPTTLREYRRLIDVRIVPAIGDVPILEVDPEHLDRWYREMVKGGLAPTSTHRIHAIVRRSLNQAVKWGWLTSNPARQATPPSGRSKRRVFPDIAVIVELIEKAVADDPGWGLFLRVAAVSGMRRGELVGLRWAAVSFDPPSLDVTAAVVDVGGRLALKEPKWSSYRRVSIDAETARLFREHRARADVLADACATQVRRDGFVWSLDPDGARPVRPEVVTARWRRLSGGVCRLHDLRHFSASQLIAAGVDVRTVASRLGHANPSTTLKIYSHAFEARDQAAAATMGGLLDG